MIFSDLTLQINGFVAPFTAYPEAKFALAIGCALPQWHTSKIPAWSPDGTTEAQQECLSAVIDEYGKAVLLFTDFANFKAWQRLLMAQVRT